MDAELVIHSDEAVRLATELAELKGGTVKTAVLAAIRERLQRERELKERMDRLMTLAREIRAHMREPVSSDHNWLYDENGLPK